MSDEACAGPVPPDHVAQAFLDERALVLAPRGRDAQVVRQVLEQAGVGTQECESMGELVAQIDAGAGWVVLTEETLGTAGVDELYDRVARQPAWADLPVVVLATRQAGRRAAPALAALQRLGNVVLLERPLNAETLVSAARASLRSRRRQYQAREQLELQTRIGRENERLYRAEHLASQQAAQAREALALALDAAELGTFHCPIPLGEVVWNETCKAHFWLPPDARVDIDLFYALIHPDDRAHTRTAVEAAVSSRQPYDVEYRTVSPQGEQRWLRAKGRAYYDEAGRPVRLDGITIDISRQKQLESEREQVFEAERRAREQAEHAGRMKDEFLATLSHELRTPLSAILGWLYVIKRPGAAEADVNKGVQAIERNARLQSRLIDELLDMSRIIAGNVSLELKAVMPAATVDTVVASLQPLADARGVRIERRLDAACGPVMADPDRLQQVVWNLLSNALKFTHEGGRVQLALTHEPSPARARRHEASGQEAGRGTPGDGDGVAVLRITDDGDGIDPGFLPHVFERFRQADGSTSRRHGGLGLGLAIVRHLVDLHGGSVEAHSEGLGRGASFVVRLPVAGARVARTSTAVALHALDGVAPEGAARVLAGLNVMLVDDEADSREVISRILADAGADTVVAGSADEALRALAQAVPDLLISDIGMPELDGYALLQQARSAGHRLPAIALTAFARNEDRARAVAAGYAVHLSKPVDPTMLVSWVSSLTRGPAA